MKKMQTRRKNLQLLGAMVGQALCAPAVFGQAVSVLKIAIPEFDTNFKIIEELLNVRDLSFDFVPYNNHYKFFDKLIRGEYVGDIIFGSTFNLSRMYFTRNLRNIDFNIVKNYKAPEFTLVGLTLANEAEFIVPLGIVYKSILINASELNKTNMNFADILTPATGVRPAFWNGDIYEIPRLVSLNLGFGFNVVRPYKLKIIDFINTNKQSWLLDYNQQRLFATGRANAIFASSSTISYMLEQQTGPNKLNYYPNEGIIVDEVAVAIPKNSRNVPVALKFINYMYQPIVRTSILQFGRLTSKNKADYPNLSNTARTSPIIYPNFKNNIPLINNIYTNEEAYQIMIEINNACFPTANQ